jgi:hypothetical protein
MKSSPLKLTSHSDSLDVKCESRRKNDEWLILYYPGIDDPVIQGAVLLDASVQVSTSLLFNSLFNTTFPKWNAFSVDVPTISVTTILISQNQRTKAYVDSR